MARHFPTWPAFAEVEVDVDTGKYNVVDFLAYADVGSVIHPRALGGQVLGRSVLGMGHALGQKWVYDPHYGAMLSTRFTRASRPQFWTCPLICNGPRWIYLIRKRQSALGGVGEPPVGGGCARF